MILNFHIISLHILLTCLSMLPSSVSAIQTVSTFSPTLENSSSSQLFGSTEYQETITQRVTNVQTATELYTDVSIYMLQPNLSNGFFELVVVEPSVNEELRTNLFQDILLLDADKPCEILIIFVENLMEFTRPLRVRLIQVK